MESKNVPAAWLGSLPKIVLVVALLVPATFAVEVVRTGGMPWNVAPQGPAAPGPVNPAAHGPVITATPESPASPAPDPLDCRNATLHWDGGPYLLPNTNGDTDTTNGGLWKVKFHAEGASETVNRLKIRITDSNRTSTTEVILPGLAIRVTPGQGSDPDYASKRSIYIVPATEPPTASQASAAPSYDPLPGSTGTDPVSVVNWTEHDEDRIFTIEGAVLTFWDYDGDGLLTRPGEILYVYRSKDRDTVPDIASGSLLTLIGSCGETAEAVLP